MPQNMDSIKLGELYGEFIEHAGVVRIPEHTRAEDQQALRAITGIMRDADVIALTKVGLVTYKDYQLTAVSLLTEYNYPNEYLFGFTRELRSRKGACDVETVIKIILFRQIRYFDRVAAMSGDLFKLCSAGNPGLAPNAVRKRVQELTIGWEFLNRQEGPTMLPFVTPEIVEAIKSHITFDVSEISHRLVITTAVALLHGLARMATGFYFAQMHENTPLARLDDYKRMQIHWVDNYPPGRGKDASMVCLLIQQEVADHPASLADEVYEDEFGVVREREPFRYIHTRARREAVGVEVLRRLDSKGISNIGRRADFVRANSPSAEEKKASVVKLAEKISLEYYEDIDHEMVN